MAKKSNKSVAKPQDSEALTDELHTQLVTWVNEFDDATQESRTLSEKSRDYYDMWDRAFARESTGLNWKTV